MVITTVDSRDELWDLVEELGVHLKGEETNVSDDKDMYLNEGDKNIQEVYDALLEDCDKYAKVPKSVVKDPKCEVEKLKEELLNAYSKIKFLKLEVIQENVKVECITIKKLEACSHLKGLPRTRPIWATPMKEAQVANPKKR